MPSQRALTDTTSKAEFEVVRPNNNVATFTFDTDPSRPGLTRITIPKGSVWTPSPHWHESHREYLHVIQGRVRVVLNGTPRIVQNEDGPQTVEKFVIHEFMRADIDTEEKDNDVAIVEEWTDPIDSIKQVFFRNLFSTIEDAERYWRGWTILQIWLIGSVYDNFDVIAPSAIVPQWLTYSITHMVFALVRLIAKVLDMKPWYEPYTPVRFRAVAANVQGGKSRPKKD